MGRSDQVGRRHGLAEGGDLFLQCCGNTRTLEAMPVENIPGELLTRPEIFGLYDASLGDDPTLTFDEFLHLQMGYSQHFG